MTSHRRPRLPSATGPRQQLHGRGRAPSVTAAVLAALYGPHALADTTVADSSLANENILQEVTVTATRREVSAQDLPMSISAVPGVELEQAGIEDVAQLARSMAG